MEPPAPPGAKLIQYQSDPIDTFKEINVSLIISEEKYTNSDVSIIRKIIGC